MLTSEVEKIHNESLTRVRVSCDEMHAHTAKCLYSDDPRDVTICKLCDTILKDRKRLTEVCKEIDSEG
ncbi:MAG: hypothetical protein SVY53_05450 [Chloroflexota bacterium]|nr:hypothetical protein [Chloroflexota bacterium]